jgi:hypothetical protein
MAVITTGKTNLALPSMRLSEPLHRGIGQQSKLSRQLYRLSLSGVDHVDRAAVPSVFDGESYDTADAYEPQPKFNVTAEIFEAWLRDSFKAGLVALSPDIRDESLINAQRRSIELSVERKQHVSLTRQINQLLEFVRDREIPHRHAQNDAIGPLEA